MFLLAAEAGPVVWQGGEKGKSKGVPERRGRGQMRGWGRWERPHLAIVLIKSRPSLSLLHILPPLFPPVLHLCVCVCVFFCLSFFLPPSLRPKIMRSLPSQGPFYISPPFSNAGSSSQPPRDRPASRHQSRPYLGMCCVPLESRPCPLLLSSSQSNRFQGDSRDLICRKDQVKHVLSLLLLLMLWRVHWPASMWSHKIASSAGCRPFFVPS